MEISDHAVWTIVLDDDPTGTQGVARTPVVLKPTRAAFDWAVGRAHACYVLTNTRAMPEGAARTVIEQAVRYAEAAASRVGRRTRIVSRGDSTLRGHFPAEVRAALSASRDTYGGVLLVPAFPEAGRVTVGGVHTVDVGGRRVPVAETEFARDATFGYTQSRLADWARARVPVNWDVVEMPSRIFDEGRGAVESFLRESSAEHRNTAEVFPSLLVTEGRLGRDVVESRQRLAVVCPHIRDLQDLKLLADVQRAIEADGVRYITQAGPSYARLLAQVSAVGTIELKALGRGLIIVGSHTDITNRQLEHAVESHQLPTVELSVSELLSPRRQAEIDRAADAAIAALAISSVVLRTDRDLARGNTPRESLRIANLVASCLNEASRRALHARPHFLIAKGGITSTEVAVEVLKWDTATVRGPLVDRTLPVWSAGQKAKGAPADIGSYVVFPGNVGAPDLLSRALDALGAPHAIRHAKEEVDK